MAVLADILEECRATWHSVPIEAEWLSSLIVSRYLKGEWGGEREQVALPEQAEDIPKETLASLTQFFKGIQRYYLHNYQRAETDMPLRWQEGSTRLLDYGAETGDDTPLVLFIPSLINRSYILDLNKERSLLGYLRNAHIHAYLLDWGEPQPEEYGFTCADYIQRIHRVIDQLHQQHKRKIALVGYCMGGLLALAAAFPNLSKLNSIALLATPWDFHHTHLAYPTMGHPAMDMLITIISHMDKVPKHLIQAFFYSHNPQAVYEKFTAFAALSPESQEAQDFVAVERWVGDGISVTCPVATECLLDWWHDNCTLKGRWQVNGRFIHPTQLPLPAFVAMAEQDHIVPPASSQPLVDLLPQGVSVTLPAGHVGMIIGRTARQYLWHDLTNWLQRNIK